MLALMELTLRGTPFIYQGQETGMTNFDFKSLADVNDVESRNLDRLMKKLHIPAFLRWRWIKASSRDNARTPMQWSAGPNAGFTAGKPWLGVNGNHTLINYESQKDDPDSVLSFYKMMIKLRGEKECLRSGAFIPVYADSRLMVYRRERGGEVYTVLLNFSGKETKLPRPVQQVLSAENTGATTNQALISSTGRTAIGEKLLPWEGVMVGR
jgi:oligo-1,6-glucosidase